ncbi:MAG: type IV secretory system conjugative DNA transfer family protein [Bacteroidetes bacterium]|nr:type IV secretory system conjugative DNA transfer family protein [Bacteroidota bacterium]
MITIIEIIIKMIAGILREIFDFIQFSILLHSQSKKYGGKFTPSSKILRRRNKGYSLGAYNSMDIKTSFKHLLVSAPSGIGKSTSVCIPSLVNLHGNGSIIILDPAKEIYKSVGHLYQDYKSYVINFSDREGNESDGWNLLPANVADLPNFTDRISNLVHGTSKDKFWQIQSAELLTTLAEPLYKLDKKYRTIANLLLLLNNLSANEELCNKFMAKYAEPNTWLEYLSFQKISDNTRTSIISSAKATLAVFRQEHIQRITSYSTFNIEDLRKEKSIVFVQTNPAELEKYKLLVSEFFNQLIGFILSEIPSKTDENVFMLLDEAGTYKIEALPLGIVQARKMRCGIMLLVQSEQQLYDLLNKEQASTIISNCSRLILTNTSLSTAREISELSGKIEFTDLQNITRVRELITVDEIRSMKPDNGILVSGHYRPSLIKLRPHFSDRRMKKVTSKEAPILKRKLPDGQIPMLDITELIKPDINS